MQPECPPLACDLILYDGSNYITKTTDTSFEAQMSDQSTLTDITTASVSYPARIYLYARTDIMAGYSRRLSVKC